MQANEVQELLIAGLDDCEVRVSGDGSHFDLLIVGEIFEGLRPVKQQQLVYAVLNPYIADGRIHAVNMRLFTPSQWQAQGDV